MRGLKVKSRIRWRSNIDVPMVVLPRSHLQEHAHRLGFFVPVDWPTVRVYRPAEQHGPPVLRNGAYGLPHRRANQPNKALQENTAKCRELSQLVFHNVKLPFGYVPAASLNFTFGFRGSYLFRYRHTARQHLKISHA